jgi:hypothetical protein
MVQATIAWLVLGFFQDGINKKALKKEIKKAKKSRLAANVLSFSPSIGVATTPCCQVRGRGLVARERLG